MRYMLTLWFVILNMMHVCGFVEVSLFTSSVINLYSSTQLCTSLGAPQTLYNILIHSYFGDIKDRTTDIVQHS